MVDSSISKFFEKSLKERLGVVADFSGLSQDELKILKMQLVVFPTIKLIT